MARFNNNNTSGLGGKIGPIVISGNTVRSKPRKRSKSSWSGKQESQRVRMKSVADLYRKAKLPVVEYVWKKTMSSGRVAYNQFVKCNMDAFDRDGVLADPLFLKLAVGELKLPYKLVVDVLHSDKNTVAVSWENNLPDGWVGGNDSLMGILFNGDTFSLPFDFKACRKDKHAELNLPYDLNDGNYMYLYFVSSDKRKISDSFSVKL